MLMPRSMVVILICLALGGCCTNGTMCMTAPTSGPAMAWDGAGQSPNEDFAPVKRPRRTRNGTNDTVVGQQQGTEPDRAAQDSAAQANTANSPAVQQPDQAALAETQLKQKLVICRGCLSKPPAAETDAALPDRQITASASR